MISMLRRLAGAMALSLLLVPTLAKAHYDDAYYHDYADLPSQSRWMAGLSDNTPLSFISIPGTHGSEARHGGWIVANQTLTLRQQLNAGIRFLDLRVRHIGNSLALHHGLVYQHRMFDASLDDVVAFLRDNPTETVLIRVKEEYNEQGNTRGFEATVDSYFDKYGEHFATRASIESPLGMLRGKIVMVKNYASFTRFGGLQYPHDFIVQDDYHLSSNWSLHGKWEKVKQQVHAANEINSDPNRFMPFINFLSGSGGTFPFFVASGHVTPATNSARLSTGMVTPFFNAWYSDFPRGDCFLWFCTIFFEGTNTLTRNLIAQKSYKYVGIVVADFPGAGLIQAVINVNRADGQFVSVLNGECLDLEGAIWNGAQLLTWPCHNNENQRFTVRGDQIVAGNSNLCLEAYKGDEEFYARVVALTCSDRQSQKWIIQPNGTIETKLWSKPDGMYVRRCMDVVAERGNHIHLWHCTGESPDQEFIRIAK